MRDVHDGITLSLCARTSSVPLVALPALYAEDVVGDCQEFWSKPRGAAALQRGGSGGAGAPGQEQLPQSPASLQRLSLRELEAVHRLGLCGFMHKKCSKHATAPAPAPAPVSRSTGRNETVGGET